MSTPVATRVTQPPSWNLITEVTTSTVAVTAVPVIATIMRAPPVAARGPFQPPVPHHAELAQREGHEHVDRVHDDQDPDLPQRVGEHDGRGQPHDDDAVLDDQPLGEVGEALRHPLVHRHRRERARPVDEARLHRHERGARPPRAG